MLWKQNDVKKLSRLYELYENKMYHVAYAILKDEWQAEDAVQDAFIKIGEHLKQIKDIESYAAKQYIIQVIRNSAIDLYRKNQKSIEKLQSYESLENSSWFSSEYEETEMVNGILQKLPKVYQDVIRLRYVEQLSVKETARELGLKETVVRKRCERGLKLLKNKIGGNIYEKIYRSNDQRRGI